jgi:xanthine dehydrogenase accessory factor
MRRLDHVSALLDRVDGGGRVAAALLVEVAGSAPLDPGAVMLVDDCGRIEGSLTGGCVEGAVVEEANAVLRGAGPRTVTYGVSDELAGTVGLTCGGVVQVLVHEVSPASAAALRAVPEAVRAGRSVGVATLVDGPDAGARLVLADGDVFGSLPGPALLCRNVLGDLRSVTIQGTTALLGYGADGSRSGTSTRVFLESFVPPPSMLIFGAGDFSAALAAMASEAGYAVTICDARAAFARAPRYSRFAEVVTAWPQEVLSQRDLGPRDVVLVFTHDPKFDEPALLAALGTQAGYIGALGSRRTTADRSRRLRAAGADPAMLERVHAPCGLDIGACTPAETAVSVLAEIIAHRTGRGSGRLRDGSGAIRAVDHDRGAVPSGATGAG